MENTDIEALELFKYTFDGTKMSNASNVTSNINNYFCC